jgi:hypothetical protein
LWASAIFLWPPGLAALYTYRLLEAHDVHPLFRIITTFAVLALIIYVVTRSAILVALYFTMIGGAVSAVITAALLYFTSDLIWTVGVGLPLSVGAVYAALRIGRKFSPTGRDGARQDTSARRRLALAWASIVTVAVMGSIVLFPEYIAVAADLLGEML